jgi:hypothetical protein
VGYCAGVYTGYWPWYPAGCAVSGTTNDWGLVITGAEFGLLEEDAAAGGGIVALAE